MTTVLLSLLIFQIFIEYLLCWELCGESHNCDSLYIAFEQFMAQSSTQDADKSNNYMR